MQQLLPQDFDARVRYCQWFLQNMNRNEILDRTFFTDEAYFHLSGYVNSQNYRTWSTENPHVFQETSLHPIKIGVWVAISRARIIGPIFFNQTINADRYRLLILDNFINQLNEFERAHCYFHRMALLRILLVQPYFQRAFPGRVISRGLWLARLPDLTPPDFFLFGYLKNNIFRNRVNSGGNASCHSQWN